MKILILPDGQNWVVDRNCQALVDALPEIDFTVKGFTSIGVEEFKRIANDFDLVHHFNADIRWLWEGIKTLTKPLLVSIRSHRYTVSVKRVRRIPNSHFHVVNEDLLEDFPEATYIPNGIFDHFKGNGFTVGYAGYSSRVAKEYDGYYLIGQACAELGVKFKPALGEILPKDMPDYYRSLDLYVCASTAEGFSTPVMECLAMNVPVISVDSGVARKHVTTIIERSVEGIKTGIRKFYTQDAVSEYRWDKLAPRYKELYQRIVG